MGEVKLDGKTRAVVLDIIAPLAKEIQKCHEIFKEDPQKLSEWLAIRLVGMIDTTPDSATVDDDGKIRKPLYSKLDVMRLLAQVNRDLMNNKVQRDKLMGNAGRNPALGNFLADIRKSDTKLPAAMLTNGKNPEA